MFQNKEVLLSQFYITLVVLLVITLMPQINLAMLELHPSIESLWFSLTQVQEMLRFLKLRVIGELVLVLDITVMQLQMAIKNILTCTLTLLKSCQLL